MKFFAVLGLVGSTVLGGLAALLKDRMTMLVRSRGDVELASGLTCVSMVPELTKRQSRAGPVTSILDQPMSGFTESIHAAVLALQAATADLPGRTVTVTSNRRFPCSQPDSLSPTPGICCDRRAFTNSFSAQMCASRISDWRMPLFVNAAVARRPAVSAMATMPSATRTSTRVKPLMRRLPVMEAFRVAR